jgi:hypothetical protein
MRFPICFLFIDFDFLYELPPLEPDLTPFRDSDPDFSTFNIGVFPVKKYFYHNFSGKVNPSLENE